MQIYNCVVCNGDRRVPGDMGNRLDSVGDEAAVKSLPSYVGSRLLRAAGYLELLESCQGSSGSERKLIAVLSTQHTDLTQRPAETQTTA